MDYYKFGNKICSLREQAGLTQKELAQKLDVSDKAISKWENGRSLPRIETLEEMSKLFDVKINELLFDDKSENFNLDEYRARIKGAERALRSEKVKKLFVYVFAAIIALTVIESCLMLLAYRITGNDIYLTITKQSLMSSIFFPIVFTVICNIRAFAGEISSGIKIVFSSTHSNYVTCENKRYMFHWLINHLSVFFAIPFIFVAAALFNTFDDIVPRTILVSVNILLLAIHCFTDKYFNIDVHLTEKGFFDESVEYGQFHSYESITDFSSNAKKITPGFPNRYRVRFVADGKKYTLSFSGKDDISSALSLFNDSADVYYEGKSGAYKLFLIPAVLGYIVLLFGFIMFVGTMDKDNYDGYKEKYDKPFPLSGVTFTFADNNKLYAFVEKFSAVNVFDEKSGKFLFAVQGVGQSNGQSQMYLKDNDIYIIGRDSSLCHFSPDGEFISKADFSYPNDEKPIATVFDSDDKIVFSVSLPSDFNNTLVYFTNNSIDYVSFDSEKFCYSLCHIDKDGKIISKSIEDGPSNVGELVDGAIYKDYSYYDGTYSISRGRLKKLTDNGTEIIYETPFFEWYKNSTNACWMTGAFGMAVSGISFKLSKKRKRIR